MVQNFPMNIEENIEKLDEKVLNFLVQESIEREKNDETLKYASSLPKFMCDNSIGKIAKHMRMLGYDCTCEPELGTNYSLFLAEKEKRIILTDREKVITKLKKLNAPKKNPKEVYSDDSDDEEVHKERYSYYFVKSKDYEEQIDEITKHFKIEFDPKIFFLRCLKCNKFMTPIDIDKLSDEQIKGVTQQIGERTMKCFRDKLTFCSECKRTFWSGNHFEKCVDFAKKHSFISNKNEN